jgi:protein-tyrosine-phosphatase/DNA-binding HxlR family transcriptional regulator
MMSDRSSALHVRARVHAALGDPARLAIVDDLSVSDRSPSELARRLGLPTNLMAHHLAILEDAGLVGRSMSSGDGRRRYVKLVRSRLVDIGVAAPSWVRDHDLGRRTPMVFLCTRNSARSQLAAALWTERTGGRASSAGTDPASRVHRGAVAAARRAGVSMDGAVPSTIAHLPVDAQIVTVCDLVHEELEPTTDWWHWSIPDPVPSGRRDAFDAVVAELEQRIAWVAPRVGPEARS